MEKVIYLLRRPPESSPGEFASGLVEATGPALVASGTRGVQVNVVDADVAPAVGLRFTTSASPPDAVVSVWLDSAIAHLRAPIDTILTEAGVDIEALLVTESEPIVHRQPTGTSRTEGFAQVALLRRPPRLDETEWLDLWLTHHTPIAVATQSTFGYTQNVTVRPLLGGSTYDAVVEELFPAAAMADQHVFYDAVGDDDRLDRNRTEMLTSVGRFLDLDRIDVVPTSRYVVQPPG